LQILHRTSVEVVFNASRSASHFFFAIVITSCPSCPKPLVLLLINLLTSPFLSLSIDTLRVAIYAAAHKLLAAYSYRFFWSSWVHCCKEAWRYFTNTRTEEVLSS